MGVINKKLTNEQFIERAIKKHLKIVKIKENYHLISIYKNKIY